MLSTDWLVFVKALSFAVERKFTQSVLNSTVKRAFLTHAKSFKIYILMWTLVPLGHLLPPKFRGDFVEAVFWQCAQCPSLCPFVFSYTPT